MKVRGWRKVFYVNGNQKKAGVAILISDKIDFKIKTVIRDKEGHYIIIKGSIQEGDITIVTIGLAKKFIWVMLYDVTENPEQTFWATQYICTQHRNTSIYKANVNRHKRRN